ncbi:MAG TPA: ankyrin repeat domain-containing protein [Candidatus Limnocylindrales bacterium]|nr:ankyrin repeat domain-containing protein [Candidatus Limnocylindrales bacterium]
MPAARARLATLATLAVALGGCVAGLATPGPSTMAPAITPLAGGPVTDIRLHQAASAGDLAAIEAMLAEGLQVDGRDASGRTPVMAATAARQTEAVRALIDAGADVDTRDNRLDNPFLYAGAEGLLDILRLVNEAGADPALTNRYGGIALIPACERGHVEVVRYLLAESDVDVDHVNNLGWTGLLEAIILADGGADHQEIVRLLLDAGADPELADRDGVTPLAHARAKGQAEIMALLVAGGATR